MEHLRLEEVQRAMTRAFENQRACEEAIPDEGRRQLRVWKSVSAKVNQSPMDAAVIVAEGMSAG